MFNPIINVYIANGDNLELMTKIINFESLQYTENVNDVNSFKLIMKPFELRDGTNFEWWEYLKNINFNIKETTIFLELDEDKSKVGYITNLQLVNGAKASEFTYTFSGLGCENFMNSRIVAPAPKINNDGNYPLKNTLTNVLDAFLLDFKSGERTSSNFGPSNIDNNKQFNLFGVFNYDIVDNPNINLTFRFKTGFEIANEILSFLQEQNLYYYLYTKFNSSTNKIDLYLRQGVDESENVKFSNIERGNIEKAQITLDFENEFNSASVAGQGEGSLRLIDYVDGPKSKNLYKELYVNASDVDETAGDGSLYERGQAKLSETKAAASIKMDLIGDSSKFYEYGKDYKIGDLIEVKSELKIKGKEPKFNFEFSQVFNVNIISVTTTFEGQYKQIDLACGEERIFVKNIVKNENSNSRVQNRR